MTEDNISEVLADKMGIAIVQLMEVCNILAERRDLPMLCSIYKHINELEADQWMFRNVAKRFKQESEV